MEANFERVILLKKETLEDKFKRNWQYLINFSYLLNIQEVKKAATNTGLSISS